MDESLDTKGQRHRIPRVCVVESREHDAAILVVG